MDRVALSATGPAGVCALLACLAGCGTDVAEYPLVRLQEVSRIEYPASWRISEAAVLPGGFVAYLQHPSRIVWWPDTARSVRLPNRRLIGMRIVGSETVEAVDSRLGELIHIKPDGTVSRVVRIADPPLWSAAHSRDTWFVSFGDSLSEPGVISVSERVVRTLPTIDRGLTARTTSLGIVGGKPVLSGLYPPFALHVVGGGPGVAEPPQISGNLIAKKVFPIDSFGLQTVVDLNSTQRHLRILSSSGRVIRQARVEAPIAIVAATADRLVMNQLGQRPALITYKWEWQFGNSSR